MKIHLKINIAAVIRWEQLCDRAFSTLDYECEEDVARLIYCASDEARADNVTFDTFATLLERNADLRRSALRELARANAYAAQFQRGAAEEESADRADEPERFSSIAARLVIEGGLQPDYVLNDMPLADVVMYAEAIGERFKREEESRRLWCWLSMRPHIAKDALRRPKDLYPFPWEQAAIAARADAEKKHLRETFDDFNEKLRAAKWTAKN